MLYPLTLKTSSSLRPPTSVDPAACDDCALVPGSLQRVRQMQSLRESGWSLDEIGLRFGVSRERVRQILRAHGGPDPQDIAAARRRRAERHVEERIDDLLALWRGGAEPRNAAATLGLQAAACRSTIARFATDVDRAARRASMAGTRGAQTYTDRDIILAVTSVAARLYKIPSAKEYARLARRLDYPSLPTVLNRMGGWASALRACGFQSSAPAGRKRGRRWTEDACWAALRRVTEELDEFPTVVGYERHTAGRADLPSSATIRNRLGRWSTIATQIAAQRELAHLRATAQSAVAAPETA